MFRLIISIFTLCTASSVLADATVPTIDTKGSKDSSLLKRYEGSLIVAYEHKSFAEFTLPLSQLEQVEEKRDNRNNHYYEPKSKKDLEGEYTRLVYLMPEKRSPLEVLRNYQDEIKSQGGNILFECKAAGCGGDPQRSSQGGGGHMSLAIYLYPEERITEPFGSNGYCAMAEHITDQRYTAAELPASSAHVSVLTYTIVAPDQNDACKAFNARTMTVVDIVAATAREQKMVTVQAGEMAKAIVSAGRVALYGIYFDFNKAEMQPESDPTLEQIAKLLQESSALKLLVVGHTDNVGNFAFNMDLSQRRCCGARARYPLWDPQRPSDARGSVVCKPHGIEQDRRRPGKEPPR